MWVCTKCKAKLLDASASHQGTHAATVVTRATGAHKAMRSFLEEAKRRQRERTQAILERTIFGVIRANPVSKSLSFRRHLRSTHNIANAPLAFESSWLRLAGLGLVDPKPLRHQAGGRGRTRTAVGRDEHRSERIGGEQITRRLGDRQGPRGADGGIDFGQVEGPRAGRGQDGGQPHHRSARRLLLVRRRAGSLWFLGLLRRLDGIGSERRSGRTTGGWAPPSRATTRSNSFPRSTNLADGWRLGRVRPQKNLKKGSKSPGQSAPHDSLP